MLLELHDTKQKQLRRMAELTGRSRDVTTWRKQAGSFKREVLQEKRAITSYPLETFIKMEIKPRTFLRVVTRNERLDGNTLMTESAPLTLRLQIP
ncbi:hypothetical protein TNCV_1880121 [Trichonephila clavipes]|nr:hypothetical protein TNCV_1880121 [Trichonephila clavipes]